MSIKIVCEIECHCGEMACTSVLDLDNPRPDGSIRLNLGLLAEQQDFDCGNCGCTTGTADFHTEVLDLGANCSGDYAEETETP